MARLLRLDIPHQGFSHVGRMDVLAVKMPGEIPQKALEPEIVRCRAAWQRAQMQIREMGDCEIHGFDDSGFSKIR